MKVLITRAIPRAGLVLLRKHPSLELDINTGDPMTPDQLKKSIKGVDAVISSVLDDVNSEIIETSGKNLKLIAQFAVGVDNVDIKAATKKGIYVSNTPGDLTEAVAEHNIALMMSIGRRIVEADKYTRKGEYKYWNAMNFLGPRFTRKTAGVVGLGGIGEKTAKILKNGFDMKVLYYDVRRNDEAEKNLGVVHAELEDLLATSDFLFLCVPLLPSTEHLIGSRELKKMKPTAYLINTSRGAVVDEDAFCVALRENWIEGAAIDVFEEEPKIYPGLFPLKNVIFTPHIGSATREARIEMSRMAAENVIQVLINKKPPVNLVNVAVKEAHK
jgi:glyoxylate reductase